MTRAILIALLSHWRRKPFQLVTLILGLALATALWSGVQAINAEARKSYGDAADLLAGGGLSELVSEDRTSIPNETYIKLRRAGWMVSPVVDGWLAADRGRVRLLGIDPFTAPPGTTMGDAITPGGIDGMLGPDGAILTSESTAERLTALSDRVRINDTIAPGLALADLSAAQALLDQTGYSRLVVHPDQPLQQTPLEDIAPNLKLEAPETADDLGRLTDSFHLNLTAFGLLSFAVGLFIVNGAVGLAFEQRRPVFRTLRALGATSHRLVLLLTLELLVFALIAGAIGILIGYVIAAALLPDVAATLRGLYGASVEGTLTLSPLWWASGIAIAIAGTALAAASGLARVARMPPLAPSKPRAWAVANDTTMRWQLGLAALCLVAALAALLIGGGLIGGFILLGGFLLASALVLPSVLALCLSAAARFAKGPIATWFWADTRQQLPGLSLALMALMLALSANIGVGTMVSSFRAYVHRLARSTAGERSVRHRRRRSRSRPPCKPSSPPRRRRPADLAHRRRGYGRASRDSTASSTTPFIGTTGLFLSASPDAWDTLATGEGAMINEQLARREGLSPRRYACPARRLDDPNRRCLRRLRQSAGASRDPAGGADRTLSSSRPQRFRHTHRRPAIPAHSADRGLRPARRQPRRPDRPQSLLDANLRAHLRRHRRAQHPDPLGRRHRHPDLAFDARRNAPAATGPGLGAWA